MTTQFSLNATVSHEKQSLASSMTMPPPLPVVHQMNVPSNGLNSHFPAQYAPMRPSPLGSQLSLPHNPPGAVPLGLAGHPPPPPNHIGPPKPIGVLPQVVYSHFPPPDPSPPGAVPQYALTTGPFVVKGVQYPTFGSPASYGPVAVSPQPVPVGNHHGTASNQPGLGGNNHPDHRLNQNSQMHATFRAAPEAIPVQNLAPSPKSVRDQLPAKSESEFNRHDSVMSPPPAKQLVQSSSHAVSRHNSHASPSKVNYGSVYESAPSTMGGNPNNGTLNTTSSVSRAPSGNFPQVSTNHGVSSPRDSSAPSASASISTPSSLGEPKTELKQGHSRKDPPEPLPLHSYSLTEPVLSSVSLLAAVAECDSKRELPPSSEPLFVRSQRVEGTSDLPTPPLFTNAQQEFSFPSKRKESWTKSPSDSPILPPLPALIQESLVSQGRRNSSLSSPVASSISSSESTGSTTAIPNILSPVKEDFSDLPPELALARLMFPKSPSDWAFAESNMTQRLSPPLLEASNGGRHNPKKGLPSIGSASASSSTTLTPNSSTSLDFNQCHSLPSLVSSHTPQGVSQSLFSASSGGHRNGEAIKGAIQPSVQPPGSQPLASPKLQLPVQNETTQQPMRQPIYPIKHSLRPLNQSTHHHISSADTNVPAGMVPYTSHIPTPTAESGKASSTSSRTRQNSKEQGLKPQHRSWLQQNRLYQDRLYARGFRVLEGINGTKVCSVCHHHFAKEMFVWRHALQHVGEKPFHCTVCDQRFTRSDTLQRHVRRAGHHGTLKDL